MAVHSQIVAIPRPLTSCWWSNALYATTKSNVMMSQHRIITKLVLVNQQSPMVNWYLIKCAYVPSNCIPFWAKSILVSMHCNVQTTWPHNSPHLLYTTLHTWAQPPHVCAHTWTHVRTHILWSAPSGIPQPTYPHTIKHTPGTQSNTKNGCSTH